MWFKWKVIWNSQLCKLNHCFEGVLIECSESISSQIPGACVRGSRWFRSHSNFGQTKQNTRWKEKQKRKSEEAGAKEECKDKKFIFSSHEDRDARGEEEVVYRVLVSCGMFWVRGKNVKSRRQHETLRVSAVHVHGPSEHLFQRDVVLSTVQTVQYNSNRKINKQTNTGNQMGNEMSQRNFKRISRRKKTRVG